MPGTNPPLKKISEPTGLQGVIRRRLTANGRLSETSIFKSFALANPHQFSIRNDSDNSLNQMPLRNAGIFLGIRHFCWVALGLILHLSGDASDFRIVKASLGNGGAHTIDFESDANSYYILLRGNRVTSIVSPAQLVLGQFGTVEIVDPSPNSQSAPVFYRLQRVPLNAPLDTDGDGMDDVYELRHPSALNPLDGSDAANSTGMGRTWLEQYRIDIQAATILSELSPNDGEGGVAVTRETFVRFSAPLAPEVLISSDDFFAEFGGRRVLSRIELSSDRQTATLFYLENLPSGARIKVTLRGDRLKDFAGYPIDADGDGLPGGTRVFGFDTVTTASIVNTAVAGTVYRSDLGPGNLDPANIVERPLQGVIIEVIGAEETIRATTDVDGRFTLSPCPAGRFFVRIDGRPCTSYLTGDMTLPWAERAYYPVIEKAWEAVAGRTNNLAGAPLSTNGVIYLPLVMDGTLQPVSANQDTAIRFPPEVTNANPALAGVEIMVPANSLLAENGARGGRVGIAPVAADRLPEPLPPGLKHTLDISIQTDGPQNFDRPVPVRFPNLPDPDTGVKLPPGAKSALWSFNHDLGRWEIAGPMTVTDDGNYVVSDPGFGVKRPGWHGTMPGSSLTIGPPGYPVERTWEEILSILKQEYDRKRSTSDAALAHQIYCIAQQAAAHRNTWGGGFIKRVFEHEANNRVHGVKNDICIQIPSWLGSSIHTVGNPVFDQFTLSDWCTIVGGFNHFVQELYPAFADNCGVLASEKANHNAFLDNAIPKCFDEVFSAGEISIVPWQLAKFLVPPAAKSLRDYEISLCVARTIGLEDDSGSMLHSIYYSPDLAASLNFQLIANSFALVPDSSYRLTQSNGQPMAGGTQWFALCDPSIATVGQDGLLHVFHDPNPFLVSPFVLYVFARSGNEFGVGQFVIQGADTDGDGISDEYEAAHGMNPLAPVTGDTDTDGDGLSDIQELLLGTDPTLIDTDGDGYTDLVEFESGSDPLFSDSVPELIPLTANVLYYEVVDVQTKAIIRG